MVDIDFVDIVVEDIVVVEIVLVDIEQDGTKLPLIHLTSAHHSSSSRYPPYFLAVDKVICSRSHRVLLIYKIYSTG